MSLEEIILEKQKETPSHLGIIVALFMVAMAGMLVLFTGQAIIGQNIPTGLVVWAPVEIQETSEALDTDDIALTEYKLFLLVIGIMGIGAIGAIRAGHLR